MAEAFMGEIKLVGFNFAPRGYALCDGSLVRISEYSALFALFNTMYGGDGRSTMGLPDLRGRSAMAFGIGPGLSNRQQGHFSGAETVVMQESQMPAHSHTLMASNDTGDSSHAEARVLARSGGGDFTGTVPAGIPVTGTVKVGTKDGNIQSAQTSETRNITGSVTGDPYREPTNLVSMSDAAIQNAGASQAHYNMSPYLVLNYIVSMAGIFPSRN